MSSDQASAYDQWPKRSPAWGLFRKIDSSVWEGFPRPTEDYEEAEK